MGSGSFEMRRVSFTLVPSKLLAIAFSKFGTSTRFSDPVSNTAFSFADWIFHIQDF
jgi:hypothetical protein